jgi:D-lyxose ketol-isomerase
MISRAQYEEARKKALEYFEKAGIVLTEQEKQTIEVADFGFGDLSRIGLELVVYVNTSKVCAKELILFPGQTCPEHIHPTKNGIPGKEETFIHLQYFFRADLTSHAHHPLSLYVFIQL